MIVQVKRVYDAPSARDGLRVLVDRLWPRGVKKDQARIDLWRRDLAPSTELRKWFNHDPEKWDDFRERYWMELRASGRMETLRGLVQGATCKAVTLLYSASDTRHNQAIALKELIEKVLAKNGRGEGV